jgi:hypothetical protein
MSEVVVAWRNNFLTDVTTWIKAFPARELHRLAQNIVVHVVIALLVDIMGGRRIINTVVHLGQAKGCD